MCILERLLAVDLVGEGGKGIGRDLVNADFWASGRLASGVSRS